MRDRILTPRAVLRGLRAPGTACALCGSKKLRLSRRKAPLVARVLGLALCRCQACWRLFLLRQKRLGGDDANGQGQTSASSA